MAKAVSSHPQSSEATNEVTNDVAMSSLNVMVFLQCIYCICKPLNFRAPTHTLESHISALDTALIAMETNQPKEKDLFAHVTVPAGHFHGNRVMLRLKCMSNKNQ
jgi:hypothetical protein